MSRQPPGVSCPGVIRFLNLSRCSCQRCKKYFEVPTFVGRDCCDEVHARNVFYLLAFCHRFSSFVHTLQCCIHECTSHNIITVVAKNIHVEKFNTSKIAYMAMTTQHVHIVTLEALVFICSHCLTRRNRIGSGSANDSEALLEGQYSRANPCAYRFFQGSKYALQRNGHKHATCRACDLLANFVIPTGVKLQKKQDV